MAGFKSFAESAEIDIDSGLTGIVGPNGCGKSNVVEGLRWVMGESSARQMRGGEMDDIIFSGTEQRPARNLAEITLQVDNACEARTNIKLHGLCEGFEPGHFQASKNQVKKPTLEDNEIMDPGLLGIRCIYFGRKLFI